MLGWFCERNGITFRIYDPGHARAATRVGAGLVSPLTGQRLAPTWRFADWRDEVLGIYRELEADLNVSLVREFRIERRFRNAQQRVRFLSRLERPEVVPWIAAVETDALIMRGAFQVDTATLIGRLRERWQRDGKLRASAWSPGTDSTSGPVIWCTGAVAPPGLAVPWEPSRGEIVRGKLDGLAPQMVLNDGQWVLPLKDDRALIGALFDRDNLQAGVTDAGQEELHAAALRLTGQSLRTPAADSGIRVNVRDRRPVVGWWSGERQMGVFGALASKGALWAPKLAWQWCHDRLGGAALDPEVRPDRFLESG
jgi:glycine oxidase